uniref:Uncharacterized protein n=1 Tax=Hyaloperonospora arabidopsidis (strain Emoy2) TaxID=559515 RepID=M4BDB3_HYAAE
MFKYIHGVGAILPKGNLILPMSSPTLGTLDTLPYIGIDHDDDVVSGVSPHGTGGSLAYRAASVEVGVPKEEHQKVLLELSGLRQTLGKTQSAFDATQALVQALESGHTRSETIATGKPCCRNTWSINSFAVPSASIESGTAAR